MKKLLIVVLVLCVSGVAHAKDWSAWTFGDNQYVGARIGYALTDNVEAGAESLWWPKEDAPQVWGVYGIYKWDNIVEIPNPILLDFLPEKFEAYPYIGARVGVNLDNDGTYSGAIAGLIIQEIFFAEFQYTDFGWKLSDSPDTDESKLVVGLRIEF